MIKRGWVGGDYEGREGIVVEADAEGITISGWYDSCADLVIKGRLTWNELAHMTADALAAWETS